MSFLTDIFSSGASKLVDSVGSALDNLITSDEERLKAKNELESIVNDFQVKMMAATADYDKEVTTRHANDMKSDSWLSKNIRPLTLAITMFAVYVLMYLTVFYTLTELQVRVLEGWIPMVVGLFGTMVVFYFGSRGMEKINIGKQK